MNTEELVKAFYTEKQHFLQEYLSETPASEVGQLIKSLHLTDEQLLTMGKIMNTTLPFPFLSFGQEILAI